jgi:ATP-binding cassette subfamily F protein 3
VRVKKGKKQDADRNVNRKDAKKQRASLVSDKSKVLSSLKSRIAALEEEITKLEQALERDTQELLEASVGGKALTIRQLSRSVNDAKARIEKLFGELETVSAEHDAKAQEFDQQLNELAQLS